MSVNITTLEGGERESTCKLTLGDAFHGRKIIGLFLIDVQVLSAIDNLESKNAKPTYISNWVRVSQVYDAKSISCPLFQKFWKLLAKRIVTLNNIFEVIQNGQSTVNFYMIGCYILSLLAELLIC